MTRARQKTALALGIPRARLGVLFSHLDGLKDAGANMRNADLLLIRDLGVGRRIAGQVAKAWKQQN